MRIKIRSREFGKNSSSANTTFTLYPSPVTLTFTLASTFSSTRYPPPPAPPPAAQAIR